MEEGSRPTRTEEGDRPARTEEEGSRSVGTAAAMVEEDVWQRERAVRAKGEKNLR